MLSLLIWRMRVLYRSVGSWGWLACLHENTAVLENGGMKTLGKSGNEMGWTLKV